MNFLNPFVLFGLAAAALPILIHLFTRRRPRDVHFPSLEFLTEVHHSEIRRLKLKQWLLLLLRTLAVAMVVLAMARPALRGSLGASRNASTTVVALVDVSGSMGAAARAGVGGGTGASANAAGAAGATLGDAARGVVSDLLSTLAASDELLLVPYDSQPHPVTNGPSSDQPRLKSALRSIAPGAAGTDHERALVFAASALAQSHALNRELFWISDFQTTGLSSPDALHLPDGPWDRSRVYLVPLSPASRVNGALTDVALSPTETGTALSVEGASFGLPPGDLAVTASEARFDGGAGGASSAGAASEVLGRGFLALQGSGTARALLPLSRLPDTGGAVSIPDDALPLDNTRWFSSGHAATLRVLLRDGGGSPAMKLALEAGSPASGLDVEEVDASTLEKRAPGADAIVINDVERLSPSELQAVLDFWRAGGPLFITLGARADASFWNASLLKELGLGELGATSNAPAGGAWRLHVAAPGHALLAGFSAAPGQPLSAARFFSVRSLGAGVARAVLSFDRDHPALLEAQHALVLCTSLEPAATDFAVSGAFLPLIHQAIKLLARGSASASLEPGDRYAAPAGTGSWRIEDPDGGDVPCALTTHGGSTRLVSSPLERVGLYRVFEGAQLRRSFAVNSDPRESDLSSLDRARLERLFPAGRVRTLEGGTDLARRVREARFGRELWRECLLLALALLVAETLIGRIGMGSATARKA
jgi:hypothetical protein